MQGFEVKPLVLAPGGFFDANWFTKFINKTPRSLQVVTHHIYNLGPGSDDHLIDKILNPSYLDGGSHQFRSLQGILKTAGASAVAWVGEAGGAYNSGRNLVTNAFVFSFWYLDQLGMASSYDTKTYCRQTLIGGNYGLLNTVTFVPNPDYYSALLWHRLMGRNVLSATFFGTNNIRAYAHCAKASKGITLLLINLDGNTAASVHVSTENVTRNGTLAMHQQNQRTKFSRGSKLDDNTREEYHLTALNGDLHSQTVLLNGNILSVNSSGSIPPLEPIQTSQSDPIIVAPFSIVFAHIANSTVPACEYVD
ncbi:HEPARANASE-LIKE PROTEIN 3 [Salix purpurea]|uniref:HEPARANASE-LIKE PROTEIN 3 n=1 Tax=Salix purpurea TaxID=77065 RepID=A0A9Q0ULX7_SALPP|nr:HEPARANASE-LIKE PROTEIN 3 [Salix purpurea]